MTRCTTAFRALVALALLLPALAAGQADERDSSRAVIGSKCLKPSWKARYSGFARSACARQMRGSRWISPSSCIIENPCPSA